MSACPAPGVLSPPRVPCSVHKPLFLACYSTLFLGTPQGRLGPSSDGHFSLRTLVLLSKELPFLCAHSTLHPACFCPNADPALGALVQPAVCTLTFRTCRLSPLHKASCPLSDPGCRAFSRTWDHPVPGPVPLPLCLELVCVSVAAPLHRHGEDLFHSPQLGLSALVL